VRCMIAAATTLSERNTTKHKRRDAQPFPVESRDRRPSAPTTITKGSDVNSMKDLGEGKKPVRRKPVSGYRSQPTKETRKGVVKWAA